MPSRKHPSGILKTTAFHGAGERGKTPQLNGTTKSFNGAGEDTKEYGVIRKTGSFFVLSNFPTFMIESWFGFLVLSAGKL
jgi:hypothetical protein